MAKLFVSHASTDLPIVSAFVDLLEGGVGLPFRDIFCTSLRGQGVKPGKDFKESIRANLGDAACAIALVSPNYYASAFSMCELGGVWLTAKEFLPILVPPLDFASLKAVLAGLHVLRLNDAHDLDQIRDELCERLSQKPHPTPRWNERRDRFLNVLPSESKKVPPSAVVSREQFESVQKEAEAARRVASEVEGEIIRLRSLNADLSKLKDAKEVSRAKAKHSTEPEMFDELLDEASKALRPLPQIVREALYYYCRCERCAPKGDDQWEEAKVAAEQGQVELDEEDDSHFVVPCQNDAKVRRAVEALNALHNWLKREATGEFFEWYQSNFEGRAELELRPFWKRHNL